MKNTQVILAKRPKGKPQPGDFAVVESETVALSEGQALVKNLYVSLDAGFRNWMDEDSGDDVLPAMPLGQAVMGLVLGKVVESRNEKIEVGRLLMARLAWEEYSLVDDSISRLLEVTRQSAMDLASFNGVKLSFRQLGHNESCPCTCPNCEVQDEVHAG